MAVNDVYLSGLAGADPSLMYDYSGKFVGGKTKIGTNVVDPLKVPEVNLDTTTPPASTGFWGSLGDAFKPQGPSGASTAGNVLSGVASGVGALSGLAGLYMQKKNMDLQKEQQNYLKSRDAMADARVARFAQNVGNGAS